MAKFVYKMQNILNIKYKLEEQARQRYMEVRMQLNKAEEVLNGLKERKELYFSQYRMLVSEKLDVLEIEDCKNAILIMDEYIYNQEKVVAAIEEELKHAADALKEALQERKIHEKLKENEFELFLQELNLAETKAIDQLVSYQYNNKNTEEA